MRFFVFSLLLVAGFYSSDAVAWSDDCLASCTTSINVDSGKTSSTCYDDGYCSCSSMWSCMSTYAAPSGQCGSYYETAIATWDGKVCCIERLEFCPQNASQTERTDIETTANSGSLEEVFSANVITTAYWGYVDSNVRSPAAGRSSAARAKLDACLFSTDVDAIDASASDNYNRWVNCQGSTYGCASTMKNEHCNATGTNDGQSTAAAVCLDRCDCVYGQGTCAGL